jgi:hypothetical protein
MATEQHPRPTGSFEGTDLGDEFLFYDREKDRVHVLNNTAREIFLLFDGNRNEGDVARTLAAKYGLDERTALEDTQTTLKQLFELGVLAS